MPPDLVADLRREVIRAERLGPAVVTGTDGPETSVVMVWLPAAVAPASLERVVGWRDRGAQPAALIGCAPEGDVADREQGLAAGFDDFVAGGFSARELAGRLRALARRLRLARDRATKRLAYGPVSLDRSQHQLWIHGRQVAMTRTELAVMRALVAAKGRALTRAEILDAAWGEESLEVGERAVDNVILRLRRKLGRERDLIVTVRGVGFRLADR